MEMCRACLSTENIMVPLDEPFITNYNFLTDLSIMLLDGMPQYSCEKCVETVKAFMEFREKSIASESMLQQVVFEKIKSEDKKPLCPEGVCLMSNSVNVKLEIKSERFDEDMFESVDGPFTDFNEDIEYLVKSEKIKDLKVKPKKTTSKSKIKRTGKMDRKLENSVDQSCGLCDATFKDKESVNRHVDSHRTSNRCGVCLEMFKSWPALLAHRIKHLPLKEKCCHMCTKHFRSHVYLEHHYMNMHFDGEKPNLTCKQCLRTYDTPRKLKKHIGYSHSNKTFVCDYCSKIVDSKQRLLSHIKKHTDDKHYVCDMCGFSCKYSGGLKDHKIRRHSRKKTYCRTCHRAFKNQADQDKHKCKDNCKICPVCGILINRGQSLTRHMLVHSNVARFKCDRCPAAYKSKMALKVHISRHDGIRTKQCEFCPLKFFSSSVLHKHRRIHTGEKPYVCKVCQKAFTGNNNLKVHMKVHGEYLVVKRNKNPEDVTTVFKFEANPKV